MTLKDAPIIEDELTHHPAIYELSTKEKDEQAFSQELLRLQARIINASLLEKEKYGHSAIYMRRDGSCIALPILSNTPQLEKFSDQNPIAITRWTKPLSASTPASLSIFTRLSEGPINVTHRMTIADTSTDTSLIISSAALSDEQQGRLLFEAVLPQLMPTNQIAADSIAA